MTSDNNHTPRYNVDLYTLCYNESAIMPIIINYWKYLQLRHIYVYDTGSTDNSVEILSQYPDWITVEYLETNDTLDDGIHQQFKNNIWKNSDADFCIVCDFDEVFYSDHFQDLLQIMKHNNYDYVRCLGAECITQSFPYISDDTFLAHKLDYMRFEYSLNMSKCLLFRPDRILEMNYQPGAYLCNPIGKDMLPAHKLEGREYAAFLLHFKNLSLDYLLRKYHSSRDRLSQRNIKNNWGIQYSYSDEKITNEFVGKIDNSQQTLAELLFILSRKNFR